MGCSHDLKTNIKGNSSDILRQASLQILKQNFFYNLQAGSINQFGRDIKDILSEQEILNYFNQIKIPRSFHKLILRIFIETSCFIHCQNPNNDSLSTLLFEIFCLFLNSNNAESQEERKNVIFLLFNMSKNELDHQLNGNNIQGYNIEMFINNIEGLLDFLITVLIFYVLLLAFLPKKELDLDLLFEGEVISDIHISSIKLDIGIKLAKINREIDWKVIKEKCLNSIFNQIQDCKYLFYF